MAYFSKHVSPTAADYPNWVSVGEAISEQAILIASQALFELQIQHVWAYGTDEVDELRRLFEPLPATYYLLVEAEDAHHAIGIVSQWVHAPKSYTVVSDYLNERSSEDLYQIIDAPGTELASVVPLVQNILLARGESLPLRAVADDWLMVKGYLLGCLLGPIGIYIIWKMATRSRRRLGQLHRHYDEHSRLASIGAAIVGCFGWIAMIGLFH